MMINIMGRGWQEITQSIIIGLIFSFLVAKLISMVISIKDANLKVTREQEEEEIVESDEKKKSSATTRVVSESDEDDWEGVESTELDEIFSAATAFVATAAADRFSQKVSNDVQLELYGLYKIATEGPCTSPQPSAIKMTTRAKWNAWQKLGAMPPEDAMEKYISIVSEIYPAWISGSSVKKHGGDKEGNDSKGPMGPVFSSFAYEEESDNELLKPNKCNTDSLSHLLQNCIQHLIPNPPAIPSSSLLTHLPLLNSYYNSYASISSQRRLSFKLMAKNLCYSNWHQKIQFPTTRGTKCRVPIQILDHFRIDLVCGININ
ncbi:hypothetical protein MKX03_015739 [Papaver bracteatum]|nr:hypothetical protein MKX03_015739 [Papaver bracteatum]